MTHSHFLPSFNLDASLREHLAHSVDVVLHHGVSVFHLHLCHERFDGGAVVPAVGSHFIAAQVHNVELQASVAIHLLQLTDHLAQEAISAFLGGVEHVVGVGLH